MFPRERLDDHFSLIPPISRASSTNIAETGDFFITHSVFVCTLFRLIKVQDIINAIIVHS